MVRIEGTYTCVKGKEELETWVAMGLPNEELEKLVGSHWTMKVWKDGNLWGGHMTCRENPAYNCLETFVDGVEKTVDHPLFGGKAKVCCKKTDDGFKTVSKSEKFGEITCIEKYTDEGVTMTYTVGGKSSSVFWQRCVKITGDYSFVKGENMAAYFEAIGFPSDNIETTMKQYKMRTCLKGSTFYTKEWFDGQLFCNALTLDVEGPLRYPDDKEGETPKRTALVTKAGVGKFVTVVKNPDGPDEEWSYTFTDCGIELTGLEKKTGQTSKVYMKRFTDMSGTYKMVTAIGFTEFMAAVGMPAEMAEEMLNDTTAKTIITDMGNGCQRQQFIGKLFSIDLTFKLNEEYSFYHPLLKETITAITAINGSTSTTVLKTSKGNMVTTVHVNDTFSVATVCLAGLTGYKVILERTCCP